MSDNQLLEEKEEVSVKEKAFRSTPRVVRPTPISIPVSPRRLSDRERRVTPVIIDTPDRSKPGPSRRVARRVLGFPAATWSFIFMVLREVYWTLDPDAKCRSVGVQTVGRVAGTETEEHEDPESGSVF